MTTEENIIRELNLKFDRENNVVDSNETTLKQSGVAPEYKEGIQNPSVSNLITNSAEIDEEFEELQNVLKTDEDEDYEDDDEDNDPLTDDELSFIKEYYDEDGNERSIREHLVGDHKIAHSPIIFEDILPDYLLDFIERRVDEIEEEDWETAETGNAEEGGANPESRVCDISWIPEIDWVSTIFTHYFNIANREIWEYDLTELEAIQVTKYDKSHFYGWHSDYGTSSDKALTRKLSMSIVISDPDEYSGGKLQFIDYMGKVQSIDKARGAVVVFDSRTPHRVTPVLKGTRISLVAWFTGPKLR